MTTEQETLRIVRSWLEDGRTRLPDHVLDAVLDQLPATPQRRPSRPARRIPDMPALAKYAIGAAAVTVVAIVGFNLLGAPGTSEDGGASPSAVASPSDAPLAPMSGAIDPGRYRWSWPGGGQVTFVLPDGWTGRLDGLRKNADTPAEFGLAHYLPGSRGEVTHVYADACASRGQLQPIDMTVDDLVAALENQDGTDVVVTSSPAKAATGSRVEVRETPGLDRSTCRHGASGPLQVWADEAETDFLALAPGHWGVVYAFDVRPSGRANGELIVFASIFGPEATDADVEEVDAIVASFEFPKAKALRLPGTTASPAGVYGWEGGAGSRAGMHRYIEDGEAVRQATAMGFAVGDDCLAASEEQQVPVRVAGFDGVSVEPYEPPFTYGSVDDPITRAYGLAVGDRTLCVYLTWNPTTTADELESAEQILDTLRAEPVGEDRVRITFTLDEGWDVG